MLIHRIISFAQKYFIWPNPKYSFLAIIGVSILIHFLLFLAVGQLIVFQAKEFSNPFFFTVYEIPDQNLDDAIPPQKLYHVPTTLIPEPPPPAKPKTAPDPLSNQTNFLSSEEKIAQTQDSLPSFLLNNTPGDPLNFFGLSPKGKTVVFLIDVSGSMLQKTGPVTRLTQAYDEIKKAIARLDHHQKFNIVLFAEKVGTFQTYPKIASLENKLKAYDFLDSPPNLGGKTNLEGGLSVSMKMSPDILLILSDGEANSPSQTILTQVRYILKKQAIPTQIYTVGFYLDKQSRAERLLQTLSDETGGTYIRWGKSPNQFGP